MTATQRMRIVLFCTLAFVFAGVADVHAHVHLCLDGQELPATVHVEGGHHVDHHLQPDLQATDSHQDVDVDVPAQAIAKTVKLEMPTLGPSLALDSLVFHAAAATFPADTLEIHRPSASCSLRPPVRGPPP